MVAVAVALPGVAEAEQASQPSAPAAGQLDAGAFHSCALLASASVRCWGFGGDGRLGYANETTIGDDETPGSAGPVYLGDAHTAVALAAGNGHTCARLDNGSVRCWGFNGNGRLGYPDPAPPPPPAPPNPQNVGDNETPGSVGPVDLGMNRTAAAISAGGSHTCAVLDTADLYCWGYGGNGRLGYPDPAPPPPPALPNPRSIGDNETPASAGPVDLGAGRTATAVSAGENHTCAILNLGDVRCWGVGFEGALGYNNPDYIGDNETPGSAGPVNFGGGRTAKAIAAGGRHTCAILDDDSVRCWGLAYFGQLGYGNRNRVGDDAVNRVDEVGPVNLGGRTATAITAGESHTCAILNGGDVRCWGYGADGALGNGNTFTIGDNEEPDVLPPVDLGPGRKAVAITATDRHTCARLDDRTVRCWGFAGDGPVGDGRLGYCTGEDIGDNESPGAVGPVHLETPGPACPVPDPGPGPGEPPPGSAAPPSGAASPAAPATVEQPAPAARRGPGRILGLKARAASKTKIKLSFRAPESDGINAPPAREYVVKQARRPIRGARLFHRAQTLCRRACRFSPPRVGAKITLTITDLRPGTTYYYAVAARGTTSKALGPRSRTVKARTRR